MEYWRIGVLREDGRLSLHHSTTRAVLLDGLEGEKLTVAVGHGPEVERPDGAAKFEESRAAVSKCIVGPAGAAAARGGVATVLDDALVVAIGSFEHIHIIVSRHRPLPL